MKQQMLGHCQRQVRLAIRLTGMLAGMLLPVVSASAQIDAVLPPLGGPDGTQFVARCSEGQHLTGFELLVSQDVDAIRPLCVIAFSPANAGPIEPYPTSFGEPLRDPDFAKVAGQLEKRQVVCPGNAPVVTGMYVRWEGRHTLTVNNIHLFCGVVGPTQTPSQYPAAVYDGRLATPPYWSGSGTQNCPAGLVAVGINGRAGDWVYSLGLICGAPRVTNIAKLGAIMKAGSSSVKPAPRVKSLPGEIRCRGYSHPGGSEYVFFTIDSRPGPGGETIVLYEMAFTPSPIAAGQNSEGLRPGECAWLDRPIGDNGPLRIRFETLANAQTKQRLQGVPLDDSPNAAESYPDASSIPRYLKVDNHYWSFGGITQAGTAYFQASGNGYWAPAGVKPAPHLPRRPDSPTQSICDSARAARARNSPAAPALEARCRAEGETLPAVDVNALADKGEAIANQDPLAVELREQQPEGGVRHGFDIGMAAAEGQTGPGPGKDRIRDSLPPDERQGFITAVAFTLERNKYAARAAKGAEIAATDPIVAEARNAETDPFYRLGFDIATAIFGDPALGAQGNTATGPGSLGIRDSLSAAGQRGFNDAVRLHLGRKY